MKIGIIAAMPEELKLLVEHLEMAEKHQRLGHVYYTGRIGHHEVVLLESGICKVMSAMMWTCQLLAMTTVKWHGNPSTMKQAVTWLRR